MFAVWLAGAAFAWEGAGAVWPEMPVSFAIGSDVAPFTDPAATEAVLAAFATWEAVPCTSARFTYLGRTDAPVGVDGVTTVTLVGAGWTDLSPSATALSTDNGAILEADVGVDVGSGIAWVLAGSDGQTSLDLQAALTREVGHLLGLADSGVDGATMNPALEGHPDARTLSDDDIEGVCTLYPALAAGEGQLGDGCANDIDCAGDFVCLLDGGRAYCAAPCANGRCAPGHACLQFAERQLCAEGGCGCAGSGGTASPGWALSALGLALAASARRRRQAAASTK